MPRSLPFATGQMVVPCAEMGTRDEGLGWVRMMSFILDRLSFRSLRAIGKARSLSSSTGHVKWQPTSLHEAMRSPGSDLTLLPVSDAKTQ